MPLQPTCRCRHHPPHCRHRLPCVCLSLPPQQAAWRCAAPARTAQTVSVCVCVGGGAHVCALSCVARLLAGENVTWPGRLLRLATAGGLRLAHVTRPPSLTRRAHRPSAVTACLPVCVRAAAAGRRLRHPRQPVRREQHVLHGPGAALQHRQGLLLRRLRRRGLVRQMCAAAGCVHTPAHTQLTGWAPGCAGLPCWWRVDGSLWLAASPAGCSSVLAAHGRTPCVALPSDAVDAPRPTHPTHHNTTGCVLTGGACQTDRADCCSGTCQPGKLDPATGTCCSALGGACTAESDCCLPFDDTFLTPVPVACPAGKDTCEWGVQPVPRVSGARRGAVVRARMQEGRGTLHVCIMTRIGSSTCWLGLCRCPSTAPTRLFARDMPPAGRVRGCPPAGCVPTTTTWPWGFVKYCSQNSDCCEGNCFFYAGNLRAVCE
jgi:hypothetical protein